MKCFRTEATDNSAEPQKNYTKVPNCVLHDRTLSVALKGTLSYLKSFRKGWVFVASNVERDLGISEKTRQKYYNQLELRGLIRKTLIQSGKWAGHYYIDVLWPKSALGDIVSENVHETTGVVTGGGKNYRSKNYLVKEDQCKKENQRAQTSGFDTEVIDDSDDFSIPASTAGMESLSSTGIDGYDSPSDSAYESELHWCTIGEYAEKDDPDS